MQNRSSDAPTCDDLSERFQVIARMTDELFTNMSAQDRDRMWQDHLAQCRGPTANGDLLCSMTDFVFALRRGLQSADP